MALPEAFLKVLEARLRPATDGDGLRSPGVAVAVGRLDGTIVGSWSAGAADPVHGVPWTIDTPTRVCSITKQMAAAVTLLGPSAPSIDLPFSAWGAPIPPVLADVTVRAALGNVSGVPDDEALAMIASTSPTHQWTLERLAAAVARSPFPLFASGERYSYCNTGFRLVARLVGERDGSGFRRVMHDLLFAPLAMADTVVAPGDGPLLRGIACNYELVGGELIHHTSMRASSGDGAVVSTLRDLLRWGAACADPSTAPGSVIDEMTAPTVLNDGTPISYGLGVRLEPIDGRRRWHHSGGAWGGYGTYLAVLPDDDLVLAVVSNRSDIRPISHGDAMLRALLGTEPSPDDRGRSRLFGADGRWVEIVEVGAGSVALSYLGTAATLHRRGAAWVDSANAAFTLTPVGGDDPFATQTVELALHPRKGLRMIAQEPCEPSDGHDGVYWIPTLRSALEVATVDGDTYIGSTPLFGEAAGEAPAIRLSGGGWRVGELGVHVDGDDMVVRALDSVEVTARRITRPGPGDRPGEGR